MNGTTTRRLLCRTIGCLSPLAARWLWPAAQVCERLTLTRQERRTNQQLRRKARR